MYLIRFIIPIIIFTLYGFVVLIKRRFMISSMVSSLLNMLISLAPIFSLRDHLKPLGIIIIYGSFVLLILLLQKGTYIIYGVNREVVINILRDFLDAKGISYEEKDHSLKLIKHNKSIDYNKSFDCVSINLRDIRKMPIYEEIKSKLKLEIEDVELKLFPIMASINIVGGIGLLILIGVLSLKLAN